MNDQTYKTSPASLPPVNPAWKSRKADASDYLVVLGVIVVGSVVGFGLGLASGLHLRPHVYGAQELADASFAGGVHSAINARLAKIDRDLDQMLAWTSNVNVVIFHGRDEMPPYLNAQPLPGGNVKP